MSKPTTEQFLINIDIAGEHKVRYIIATMVVQKIKTKINKSANHVLLFVDEFALLHSFPNQK
jgi:hypothetical protein